MCIYTYRYYVYIHIQILGKGLKFSEFFFFSSSIMDFRISNLTYS